MMFAARERVKRRVCIRRFTHDPKKRRPGLAFATVACFIVLPLLSNHLQNLAQNNTRRGHKDKQHHGDR